MSILEPASERWTQRALSVLRIVAAIVFVEHGTQKLFGVPPSPVMQVPVPLPSLLGFAGVIETVGGFAILFGLLTRPVAFVLAGEMAVAYFKEHFPRSFFPVNSGGDPAVLFCFIFIYLVFAGGGWWSVDAAIARSRRQRPPGDTARRRHLEAAA